MVNDNLFTNVMARFNLAKAAEVVRRLADEDGVLFDRLVDRLGLEQREVDEWAAAAEAMSIPYDEGTGIHPQDSRFLDREVWDLKATPADRAAAAAALPPAGDLPLPGAQAGRRRARAVPAGRPLHARGEAGRLRLLRPDHHR